MEVSRKTGFIVLMLVLATIRSADGQVLSSDNGTPPPENESEATADSGKSGLHYQLGGFYPIASDFEREGNEQLMGTLDLSWVNWSRTESSFGLGLHVAAESFGTRFGLKGLWRTPVGQGGDMYFQIAPGINVASVGSDAQLTLPSFFLETELGLTRYFALVAGLEVLPHDGFPIGWDYQSSQTMYSESGTANSLYLGAKVGQKPAEILTIIGVFAGAVAGTVVLISFSRSDGFFE